MTEHSVRPTIDRTPAAAHPTAGRPANKHLMLGVIATVALVDRAASALSRRSRSGMAEVVALPLRREPAHQEQRAA